MPNCGLNKELAGDIGMGVFKKLTQTKIYNWMVHGNIPIPRPRELHIRSPAINLYIPGMTGLPLRGILILRKIN
jgi:hypothetical protein